MLSSLCYHGQNSQVIVRDDQENPVELYREDAMVIHRGQVRRRWSESQMDDDSVRLGRSPDFSSLCIPSSGWDLDFNGDLQEHASFTVGEALRPPKDEWLLRPCCSESHRPVFEQPREVREFAIQGQGT